MTESADHNPYASPLAEDEPGDPPVWDAFSRNGLVVTAPKSELPARCFVCNQPATRRHRMRRDGWVTMKGLVSVSLLWYYCDTHHKRQWIRRLSLPATALLILLLLQMGPVVTLAIQAGNVGLVISLAVAIVLLVSTLYGIRLAGEWIGGRPTIVEVTPARVKVKGAGAAFLASIHRPA
ncbi:hypothetical protein Pla123a_04300 [Posidoniimonas polymericola]|uniref:Uncharacterized protein n=1 Tax=Posidoniimonas polymericola TaxID=2528002 RepID=A0A5C5ZGD2_9BACT|nr:hypothetical protein [Posidoniimonas polymericola]TWT85623.1 hypothetical protein Pla123a_04300 [Posidoniimonas polymericola]